MAVDGKIRIAEKPSNFIVKFFRGIKAEVKRITWPSKKDVKKATGAVAVLCLIYVVCVGIFDYAFQSLFELVFKIK